MDHNVKESALSAATPVLKSYLEQYHIATDAIHNPIYSTRIALLEISVFTGFGKTMSSAPQKVEIEESLTSGARQIQQHPLLAWSG